jgi:hypothetical protein
MSTKQIGRLALREEGDNWVAYYAMPDTMKDAILLGSIRTAIVGEEKHKQAFMALMREIVSDIIEETMGVRPIWPDPPMRAPEHERAGRA